MKENKINKYLASLLMAGIFGISILGSSFKGANRTMELKTCHVVSVQDTSGTSPISECDDVSASTSTCECD